VIFSFIEAEVRPALFTVYLENAVKNFGNTALAVITIFFTEEAVKALHELAQQDQIMRVDGRCIFVHVTDGSIVVHLVLHARQHAADSSLPEWSLRCAPTAVSV